MRAVWPRAGSVPPRPSPRWRSPARQLNTIKNTRQRQVFSSVRVSGLFGAQRMCASLKWSVVPTAAGAKLHAGINQSCSHRGRTYASCLADCGKAFAISVALSQRSGVELRSLLAWPPFWLKLDTRIRQPSPGGLEGDVGFRSDGGDGAESAI